jgi:hypothetical protein
MVSIAAFQAVDPSSILGHRIVFFPFSNEKSGIDMFFSERIYL